MYSRISSLRFLSVLALVISSGGLLSADVVETANGSRLVGTVVSASDGELVFQTDYAGEITLDQSTIVSISTDSPVAVRLDSGTRVDGVISGSAAGLSVAAPEGTVGTSVGAIAAIWAAGEIDPAVAALQRHWAYEAAVDVTGRSGNKSQFGSTVGFRAVLDGVDDKLVLATSYNRQESDGRKSADAFRASIDYSQKFQGENSWYVRDEGGFDRIRDIQFYNVAAAGLGRTFIDQPKHELTGRVGLSYRAENYRNPATRDLSTMGLDVGLEHMLEFDSSRLINRIAYIPSFDDFANYRVTHESTYEIPLSNPAWKLRLGVLNDYQSKPEGGLERLDTTYYTRLVLNWGGE